MSIASGPNDSEMKAVAPRARLSGVPMFAASLAARSASNLRSTMTILQKRRKNRLPVYPALGWKIPFFLVLAALVSALAIDIPLAQLRQQWPSGLGQAAQFTTAIGLSGWYLFPAVFVLLAVNLTDWHGRSRRQLLILYNWTSLATFVLISVGIPGVTVNIIKRLIGRARPEFFNEHGAFGFDPFTLGPHFASFPSGHATTVGSVAGILLLLFPAARYASVPVAIWLATTRVIVGAHHPSDIVAGLALGFFMAIGAGVFMARMGYIFRQNISGLPRMKKTARILW